MKIKTALKNSVARENNPPLYGPDDTFQMRIFSRVGGPVFFYLSDFFRVICF